MPDRTHGPSDKNKTKVVINCSFSLTALISNVVLFLINKIDRPLLLVNPSLCLSLAAHSGGEKGHCCPLLRLHLFSLDLITLLSCSMIYYCNVARDSYLNEKYNFIESYVLSHTHGLT